MTPSRILAGILLAGLSAIAAAEKPNVLFLAVDDLRPELASFGAKQMLTPNVDALMRRGVRFERAYCMVPTCGASRAALMSGLRPSPSRFTSYLTRASKDAPGVTTLNTHFKNHSYYTVSLGKIFHHPDDNVQGWSEKPWRPQAQAYATDEANAARVRDAKGRSRGPSWENGGEVPDDFYGDGKTADQAIAQLHKLAGQDEPFFLAVGFFKPHLPFVAPGRHYEPYPADSIQMPDNYFPPKNAPPGAVHNSGELRAYSDIPKKGVLPEAKARELIRGYYAATSYTDACIGRVMAAFDELELGENTIVVLWGDHGWNLGEHTLWCKHSCFETSVRAPLFFAAPKSSGLADNAATPALTEFIDVYPTLCDLAGIPKPDHLQGTSLVPILQQPENASVKDAAISRFGHGDTIRTDRYRYTVYAKAKNRVAGHMLYDHETDPGENVNVADDPAYAEIVRELAAKLEAGRGK
tara:strand:- start:2979 stop:4379 length:1401 start_codon:yes stop_codon:yes gene_type:complete